MNADLTHEQYIAERLFLAEVVLGEVMAVVIEIMPPNAQSAINRIGFQWNEEIDVLDARRVATTPSAALQSLVDQAQSLDMGYGKSAAGKDES